MQKLFLYKVLFFCLPLSKLTFGEMSSCHPHMTRFPHSRKQQHMTSTDHDDEDDDEDDDDFDKPIIFLLDELTRVLILFFQTNLLPVLSFKVNN